jgi:preprotein translocase subunit YajC
LLTPKRGDRTGQTTTELPWKDPAPVDSLGPILPFIVILGAFWLLIIRPARSKQRAQQNLQRNLTVGSEVMLTSGLYGTIVEVEDDRVVIETSPGVTMRWAKPAVARILTPAEPETSDDEQQDQSGDTPDGTAGTESTEQR